MAHTVATHAVPFGALTVHRIVTAVSNVAGKIRRWSEKRRTVNELSRLSRRQLEDIGLTPADVQKLADGSY